jgi:tRNA(Ile)-lysidine synthase TilS/MesJ
MIKCHKCSKKAVIHQKYSGMFLCRDHFQADVHRKVRESIRKTLLFGRGARVAVALGGDKKSATLLYILKDLFSRRRDIELLAVIIDEGIDERRARPAYAIAIAERLEAPFVVDSLRAPAGGAGHEPIWQENVPVTCEVCAARKKSLLYRMAQEMGADALATGQCLDDEAQAVLLSYLRGDIAGLLQLQPSQGGQAIPLITPLQRIPEREVGLYASIHGLRLTDSGTCARNSADRLAAKRLLNAFDSRHPGTKYSLLRSLERVIELEPERVFSDGSRCDGSQGQSL